MTEAEFLTALRRLPLHPGAGGLADDTATVGGFVVTTDTLVEGVHFLDGDPPGDVAWKLVATNLSDLAAKGAIVEGVLLNYPLRRDPSPSPSPAKAGAQLQDASDEADRSVTDFRPTGPRPAPGSSDAEEPDDAWDARFLAGLAEILVAHDAPLIGGDTVSLPVGAPRVLTVTAIGRDAPAPPRSGARAGDALWVTGSIGDAGAGLAVARGRLRPDDPGHAAALLAAYRRPVPRLADGRALAPLAHAMMDVSDGLLIDAARMAAASGLAVAIDLARVPLSAACRAVGIAPLAAATAGDDYQLLFALPADAAPPVPATRIGGFATGAGLALTDAGVPVALPERLGFEHAT